MQRLRAYTRAHPSGVGGSLVFFCASITVGLCSIPGEIAAQNAAAVAKSLGLGAAAGFGALAGLIIFCLIHGGQSE